VGTETRRRHRQTKHRISELQRDDHRSQVDWQPSHQLHRVRLQLRQKDAGLRNDERRFLEIGSAQLHPRLHQRVGRYCGERTRAWIPMLNDVHTLHCLV
jgi:hypothetical protein